MTRSIAIRSSGSCSEGPWGDFNGVPAPPTPPLAPLTMPLGSVCIMEEEAADAMERGLELPPSPKLPLLVGCSQ